MKCLRILTAAKKIWTILRQVILSPFRGRNIKSLWDGFDRAQDIAAKLYEQGVGPEEFKSIYRYEIMPLRLILKLSSVPRKEIHKLSNEQIHDALVSMASKRLHKYLADIYHNFDRIIPDYDYRYIIPALKRQEWLAGRGPVKHRNNIWRHKFMENPDRRRKAWKALSDLWILSEDSSFTEIATTLSDLRYKPNDLIDLFTELDPILYTSFLDFDYGWDWMSVDMRWVETRIIDKK